MIISGNYMVKKVVKIPPDAIAVFKKRPNRFLGIVDILKPDRYISRNVEVHIQDPGRLKELLFEGNTVLLKKAKSKKRRTGWDVIAANHDGRWILVNSSYHRMISGWLINTKDVSPFKDIKNIQAEVRFGTSRLDYHITNRKGQSTWVEVKGCTLTENGTALFPDAPTERGRKHLRELIKAKKRGTKAAVIVLVFRDDSVCFLPNRITDPEFADLFYKAIRMGVRVIPVMFGYEDGMIYYLGRIPVCGY